MLSYNKKDIEEYKVMLKNTGALSRLFSESAAPYLVSRSTENIYCEAFKAENLSRSDCTADAKYKNVGIGIKTFLEGNGRTLQKVAEFNKQTDEYRNKTPKELIYKVAELRNERIRFTEATHNLTHMIYHCVTREDSKILIYEEPMDPIQIKSIKNINAKKTTISFEDGLHEYSFNITKSTLYKRFNFNDIEPMWEIDVNIIEQPYRALEAVQQYISSGNFVDSVKNDPEEGISVEDKPFVILPLFSDRGERHVPERSGLNQWNAKGRPRDANEIYVPIPAWLHRIFNGFFPARDQPFNLQIPDGRFLNVKLCQEGSKALMSNPNSDLGKWLLRDVFALKDRQLLKYEDLELAGIDSVCVTKLDENNYKIDFCELGTYDKFVEEHA